ncbi:MAG: PEGA domain-containing protein [Polyangiaceae bacterium]|nr:PEGA domain-containing protein [Polyangiaceae bacterium]
MRVSRVSVWTRRAAVSCLVFGVQAGFAANSLAGDDSAAPASTAPASTAPTKSAEAAPAAADAKPLTAEESQAAARAAYGEGEAAFAAKDFATAVAKFTEANTLSPSPHADYWIAMSLDAAGKVIEALAKFEALLADPDAKAIGEEKLQVANERAQALAKTPAVVTITLTKGAALTVDGLPSADTSPVVLSLSPGKHVLEVFQDGFETQNIDLALKPGESLERTVELSSTDPAIPPIVVPEDNPAPEPAETVEPNHVPAYVTLGIAGASAIVGGIFGFQAMNAKGDFDDNPTSDHADGVERNALIADMAFGVALTLGITGIVLLTAEDEKEMAQRKTSHTARLRVAPFASPTSAGAAARLSF